MAGLAPARIDPGGGEESMGLQVLETAAFGLGLVFPQPEWDWLLGDTAAAGGQSAGQAIKRPRGL